MILLKGHKRKLRYLNIGKSVVLFHEGKDGARSSVYGRQLTESRAVRQSACVLAQWSRVEYDDVPAHPAVPYESIAEIIRHLKLSLEVTEGETEKLFSCFFHDPVMMITYGRTRSFSLINLPSEAEIRSVSILSIENEGAREFAWEVEGVPTV